MSDRLLYSIALCAIAGLVGAILAPIDQSWSFPLNAFAIFAIVAAVALLAAALVFVPRRAAVLRFRDDVLDPRQ